MRFNLDFKCKFFFQNILIKKTREMKTDNMVEIFSKKVFDGMIFVTYEE